jgi:uncharacterized Zn finger protein (UPF0148 family)
MSLCQICGNTIDTGCICCPYCQSEQLKEEQPDISKAKFYQKTVNIEEGLPTVEQALARLKSELHAARQENIRILTLIHGYGSTGKGGVIRQECRKMLDYIKSLGDIHTVIHGEEFNRRNGPTRHILSRFPELSRHPHLNHNNKGITLVQMY